MEAGLKQLDPFLAQESPAAEKSEHLVAEELPAAASSTYGNGIHSPESAAPRTQRVDVGVELRPLAVGLDHRHHPGAKALLLRGRRHQLLDGLVGGRRERAEKLAMVQEVDPQHLGYGEHPLGMAHVLHDLVLEEGGKLGHPLGATGGTHSSTLAGERHQEPLGTPPAANPCEAALPQTAREIARHGLVHETPPEAVAALEALLPPAPGVRNAEVPARQTDLGAP